MTFHSDILDCVGFLRADVLPLLTKSGITVSDALQFSATVRDNWPDWKRRLATSDYLTDAEAAAALAGVDIFAPGFLCDEDQAELSHWQEIVKRACHAGSLKAEGTGWNGDATPGTWEITPQALAVWCAAKGCPFPLPGIASMPATDAGLREALAAADGERAQWKAKAEALAVAGDNRKRLQVEIGQCREELRGKAEDLAALTAERDALKADVLAGKAKTTALRIIGGLVMKGYGMNIHAERLAGIGEMVDDLQRVGAAVTEKTLREWIKEAADLIEPMQGKN